MATEIDSAWELFDEARKVCEEALAPKVSDEAPKETKEDVKDADKEVARNKEKESALFVSKLLECEGKMFPKIPLQGDEEKKLAIFRAQETHFEWIWGICFSRLQGASWNVRVAALQTITR